MRSLDLVGSRRVRIVAVRDIPQPDPDDGHLAAPDWFGSWVPLEATASGSG